MRSLTGGGAASSLAAIVILILRVHAYFGANKCLETSSLPPQASQVVAEALGKLYQAAVNMHRLFPEALVNCVGMLGEPALVPGIRMLDRSFCTRCQDAL